MYMNAQLGRSFKIFRVMTFLLTWFFISEILNGTICQVSLHELGGGNWVADELLFVKIFSK